ncbi:FliH/SctL family protein [Endozoicomonas sp. Mp262]|uniref:FliH/SctL family protein n=1 Tax=Endozoicomonas sp. Mp262 TaxID=2919499 RepID=UPI0021D80974
MRKVTIFKSGVAFKRHRFPNYGELAGNLSPITKLDSGSGDSPKAIELGTGQEGVQNRTHMVSQEILEAARQEAYDSGYRQGIEVGTMDGMSQGREQGQRDALQHACSEGHEKGYREGLSQGQEEIQKVLNSLSQNLQGFEHLFSGRKQELYHWLAEMVKEVCRSVIRTELKLQPEAITAIVHEALQHLPENAEKLAIHVNPSDLLHIKQFQSGSGEGWSLIEDITIEPGDCRIVTDQVEASASVEDRLSACMDVVREVLPEELERSGA